MDIIFHVWVDVTLNLLSFHVDECSRFLIIIAEVKRLELQLWLNENFHMDVIFHVWVDVTLNLLSFQVDEHSRF